MPTSGRRAGGDRVVTEEELAAIDNIQRESRKLLERFEEVFNPSGGDLTYIKDRIDFLRADFMVLGRRQLRAAVCKKLGLPGTYAQALRIGVSPAQVSQSGTERDNYRNFSMTQIMRFDDAKKGIALAVYFSAEDLPRRLAPALRGYIESDESEARLAVKMMEYRTRYQAAFGSDPGPGNRFIPQEEVVQTTPITEIVEPAPAAADVPFDPSNLGMYRYYMPKTFDLIYADRQRGGDQLGGGAVTFVGGNPRRASQARSIMQIFNFLFAKYQFNTPSDRLAYDEKLAQAISAAVQTIGTQDTFLSSVRLLTVNGQRDFNDQEVNTAVEVRVSARNRRRYRTMIGDVYRAAYNNPEVGGAYGNGLPVEFQFMDSFMGRSGFFDGLNFYLPIPGTPIVALGLVDLLNRAGTEAQRNALTTQLNSEATEVPMVPFTKYVGYTDSATNVQNLTTAGLLPDDTGMTAEPQTEEVVETSVQEDLRDVDFPVPSDFNTVGMGSDALELFMTFTQTDRNDVKALSETENFNRFTREQAKAFGGLFESIFNATLPRAPRAMDSLYRKVFMQNGLLAGACAVSSSPINGFNLVQLIFPLNSQGNSLPEGSRWAKSGRTGVNVSRTHRYGFVETRQDLNTAIQGVMPPPRNVDVHIGYQRNYLGANFQALTVSFVGRFDFATGQSITAANKIELAFKNIVDALSSPSIANNELTRQQTKAIAPRVKREIGTDSMTFGFEAEGFFDEMSKAEAADKLNDMNTREATVKFKSTRYHQSGVGASIYKLESDSSVRGTGMNYGAFELVTPVIGRQSTVDKFKLALDRLRMIGARNDSSGGVHIHLQAKGLTFEQQRNWYLNAYLLQPFLLQCVPYSWRGRDYARPMGTSTRQAQAMAAATNFGEFIRNADTGRSRLLNVSGQYDVNGFNRQPTYEWRFPGGGFETDTSMMLVRMLAAIRAAGMDGLLQHTTTGPYGDLSRPQKREEMLEDLLGQDVYSFWISRIRDISTSEDRATPDVGRSAGGSYKAQVSYPMPFNLY
jgi:hypothetical protein